MFKGYQDTSRSQLFKGFPNLNFQMNNEAYGFSGCTFWLDAAYGLNTQTDLAAVSSWKDRISNWEFAQATAGNQPRLDASNANFNNYPTIEFFDTARFMDSQRGGLTINKATTVAFVAKYDTINTTNVVLGSQSVAGQMGLGGTLASVNGPNYISTGSVISSGTTESTTTKIVIINLNEIVVDGVQEFSGGIADFPDWTCDRIGRRVNTTAQQLRGHIGEILIFNNVLSSTDMVRLSDNINLKYALY